jgi:hypothetical protein
MTISCHGSDNHDLTKDEHMKILLSFLAMISVASAQTIVCKKQTDGGEQKIIITKSKVIVSLPGLISPRVFNHLTQANGLITDYGLAIYSENHYGCIRNVLVITDQREPFDAGYMGSLNFGTCSGGSTPDEICHPDN